MREERKEEQRGEERRGEKGGGGGVAGRTGWERDGCLSLGVIPFNH